MKVQIRGPEQPFYIASNGEKRPLQLPDLAQRIIQFGGTVEFNTFKNDITGEFTPKKTFSFSPS